MSACLQSRERKPRLMSTLEPQDELSPQVEHLERIQQRWKQLVEGAGAHRPTEYQPCTRCPLGKRLLKISFKRPLSLRSFSGSLLRMGVRQGGSRLVRKRRAEEVQGNY